MGTSIRSSASWPSIRAVQQRAMRLNIILLDIHPNRGRPQGYADKHQVGASPRGGGRLMRTCAPLHPVGAINLAPTTCHRFARLHNSAKISRAPSEAKGLARQADLRFAALSMTGLSLIPVGARVVKGGWEGLYGRPPWCAWRRWLVAERAACPSHGRP